MSTETNFQQSGTLSKPGPIGRVVRLVLGLGAFYALYQVVFYRDYLIRDTLPYSSWWPVIVLALLVFPYVINLGWGRSWGRWPQLAIVFLLALLVLVTFSMTGNVWGKLPGSALAIWLAYTFVHLGLSFVLSTVIATPGCEMRAIPHLWTLLSGRPTAEHHCPGPLDGLDRWESGRPQ